MPARQPVSAPRSSSDERLRKPIHNERLARIICIGAGASGLLLAYKLQRSFENYELTIYEKNDAISGTWYENKYPGCSCDIPAHTYTWSFDPNPNWSSVYAGSDEIHSYFNRFSDKYGLAKYCRMRHEVTKAVWNEDAGTWTVEVVNRGNQEKITQECDILINASGVLNAWKWPDLPGLETYEGKLVHTAAWDTNIDLRDKHVGLIGNGSSGIQVLPAIYPAAKKITTFIRSATWVAPVQGFQQRVFSQEECRNFEDGPDVHLEYRKTLETRMNARFPSFILDTVQQAGMRDAMTHLMKTTLNDETLEKLMIPEYPVGCRRFTPGINYLECVRTEKVEVVYGQVQRITQKGCIGQDGKEYPVDVLICATGFDTSYKPRFPIIGRNGVTLSDAWAIEAEESYLGLAAHGFPNSFVFIGPNSPIGNGPVLIAVEAQADYMLKMIDRWQTENIHSFAPKREAVADFVEHTNNFMKRAVWQQECRSWYKKNSVTGRVTAIWPGSTLHYLEAVDQPRYDDWDVKYNGNRFAFLGNGFSRVEVDTTADWAYYLRNEDDSPFMSRGKRRRVFSRSGTIDRSGEEYYYPRFPGTN
ncbi:FAD/NAD(P)-binding domain-containing protein [Agrocybe pediades]|nr:FAD/NAD(P)-binding domain-containing protein [Agrocybe pediades]